MMALEIWRCDRPEEHEPHTWIKVRHGKNADDPRLGPWRVQCYGEKVEPFVDARRDSVEFEQALVNDEVTLGQVSKSPEFDLAQWFVCVWRGHRWRWLVRYRWGGRGWFAFSPVAERCSRCGIRRNPDPVRWLAQLSRWGAES
ncbi:hypothetical protein SEA_ANNASERENA_75 [Microbacterium phage AnnaSerena]|uniref:Uncharacterized protein n=5 Tax=Krampusvirus krampus TaxID=2734242 RepID=A0A2Z4Q395_9CAUD|nr:hypothetical protein SEA_ANNASERENA_75 [Microbacterium phage AnnaSerena]QDF18127.1 hypothetical protein SEA_ANAKIN_75 [Microbacterium phage Anakin]QDF18209.1 hypothetical protein SEA_NARUTORUN_75 [Microbacterium phage NarutoRun]UDG78694.1 hypothetical protein SEA_NEPTUNE_75 [Microbacterium phage Neptune]